MFIERPAVFITLIYRRLRYGYAFRRIPLTKGKYAIVDPQDYIWASLFKWQARPGNHTFYAGRSGPKQEDGKRKVILMHREVMPVPEWMFVDHINHNGLDNRRANLRPATKVENSYNRRKIGKKTASRYKGAWWDKYRNKWGVSIGVDGKTKHIGRFESEIEAAKAYDEAARKYHKDFAEPNF